MKPAQNALIPGSTPRSAPATASPPTEFGEAGATPIGIRSGAHKSRPAWPCATHPSSARAPGDTGAQSLGEKPLRYGERAVSLPKFLSHLIVRYSTRYHEFLRSRARSFPARQGNFSKRERLPRGAAILGSSGSCPANHPSIRCRPASRFRLRFFLSCLLLYSLTFSSHGGSLALSRSLATPGLAGAAHDSGHHPGGPRLAQGLGTHA